MSTSDSVACFALSAAPAKSPSNNFFIAVPANPNVSSKELNLSMILFLIASPKLFTEPKGSSNILLKNPVILSLLLNIKLAKSLNAIDKNSNAVLNASATTWFSLNMSLSNVKAATAKPIPAPFKAVPIPLIPFCANFAPTVKPLKPFFVVK